MWVAVAAVTNCYTPITFVSLDIVAFVVGYKYTGLPSIWNFASVSISISISAHFTWTSMDISIFIDASPEYIMSNDCPQLVSALLYWKYTKTASCLWYLCSTLWSGIVLANGHTCVTRTCCGYRDVYAQGGGGVKSREKLSERKCPKEMSMEKHRILINSMQCRRLAVQKRVTRT